MLSSSTLKNLSTLTPKSLQVSLEAYNMATQLALGQVLLAWSFLTCLGPVVAQTFPDYPLSNTWPGLSQGCLSALNITIQCAGHLAALAEKYVSI